MTSAAVSFPSAVPQPPRAPNHPSPSSSPRRAPLTLQCAPLRIVKHEHLPSSSSHSRRRRVVILPPVAKFAPSSYGAGARRAASPAPSSASSESSSSATSSSSSSPASPAPAGLSWPVYQAALRARMAGLPEPSAPVNAREMNRRVQVMA